MLWGYIDPMTLRAWFLALLLLPGAGTAQSLGVNFYGLSYHFDRERARQLDVDNEVNPGLGVRWRVPHSERLQWILDAGAYRDSGRNTARLAGAGALWKVSEGWRLGAALALLNSDTYNEGKTFVAPFPVAAYEFRSATLNFVYLPKVSEEINEIATLGFWVTIWLR
jgi:hypothetical protein